MSTKKFIRSGLESGHVGNSNNRVMTEVNKLMKEGVPYIEDIISKMEPSTVAIIIKLPNKEAYNDESIYKPLSDKAAKFTLNLSKRCSAIKRINNVFAYPALMGFLPGADALKFFENGKDTARSARIALLFDGEKVSIYQSSELPNNLKVTWSK